MKRYVTLILVISLCLFLCFPVSAGEQMPRLIDEADLLTNSEEASLLATLNEISERQGMDIVVLTVYSLDGKSPRAYADDFYDNGGYGYDGILLLLSMEFRDWYISTSGYGITALTDAGIDYISDQFLPALSSGKYADAFTTYATLCDDFIDEAKTGKPYDIGSLPKAPFAVGQKLLLSLVIGFVIAFIITSIMKSKLKSVKAQAAANNYVRAGSLQITHSHDRFLYRHVDRRARPQNNGGGSSTHTSSSGRSHGGGGGKF